jgi:hypothetical protein
MTLFWRRNLPLGDVDIGQWIKIVEASSMVGIVLRLAIVYFTGTDDG